MTGLMQSQWWWFRHRRWALISDGELHRWMLCFYTLNFYVYKKLYKGQCAGIKSILQKEDEMNQNLTFSITLLKWDCFLSFLFWIDSLSILILTNYMVGIFIFISYHVSTTDIYNHLYTTIMTQKRRNWLAEGPWYCQHNSSAKNWEASLSMMEMTFLHLSCTMDQKTVLTMRTCMLCGQ